MLRLRTLLPLLLCAHAFATPASASHQRSEAEQGEKIAQFAKTFIGVRYSYGGSSPRTGFDCSGLVAYVYRHFGVTLPHYTLSQFARGRPAARAALRPGDLVFFNALGHVGIYVGRGRLVEALHSGTRVRVASLGEGWYRSTFDGARRIASA